MLLSSCQEHTPAWWALCPPWGSQLVVPRCISWRSGSLQDSHTCPGHTGFRGFLRVGVGHQDTSLGTARGHVPNQLRLHRFPQSVLRKQSGEGLSRAACSPEGKLLQTEPPQQPWEAQASGREVPQGSTGTARQPVGTEEVLKARTQTTIEILS